MRRYLLISVLIFVVLAATATGIGWYLLHDESFLKSHLRTFVLRQTGRELTIDGPLRLSLGRVTTLDASGIHFADADWTDQPDMVAIGHLAVAVRVASLFEDKPVLPSLALEDCVVFLVKNESGEANWDILPHSEPEPTPEKQPQKGLPVWIKNIAVHNCRLKMSGPRLEKTLDIKITGLSTQHLEDDRLAARGTGSVNDEALSFDGWAAPLSSVFFGGPLEHELELSLAEIVTMQSSGFLKDVSTLTGANITAEVKGPDIAEILDEFSLPRFSDGAFDYRLSLNTEGKMTRLNLDGDLGSLVITASGELDRLIRPTGGNVQFSVNGPNLGALARVFNVDGLAEDAFSHEAHATFEKDVVHFKSAKLSTASDHLEISGHFNTGPGFSGADLDIHFDTTEASRWSGVLGPTEQNIGPIALGGKLSSDSEGLFSVRVSAVQGASTLDADGTLGYFPDRIQPDLDIKFFTPDPSNFAALAGLKGFPAAPLAVQGRFALNGKQVRLDKVNIDLAGDKAHVDGLLNLENRYAGSDIRLDLDISNARNLGQLFGRDDFPDQPVKLSAGLRPSGKGLEFQVNDGNTGRIKLRIDGRIADLQQPLGINANFDVSLPKLSNVYFLFPGRKVPDAPFTAQGRIVSTDKQVQLEKVNIDLAGNKANIDGYINLVDHYTGSTLNFDLDVINAGDLGRLFGKDDLPQQPLRLTAVLKPIGRGLEFKVSDGNLGEMQLDMEGRIADLDQPLALDASFDIKLPLLSHVAFLLPGRDLPQVPFSASGRLHNEQSKTRLDQVKVQLGRIKATFDGDLLPDNGFDLTVNAAGPDASVLDKLAGFSLQPDAFTFATQLSGNPSDFHFQDLNVTLGKSQAGGVLNFDTGAVTRISGAIVSSHLDLSFWNSQAEAEAKARAKKVEKPASKSRWVFDDTHVMSVADHGFDIDIDIDIARLDFGQTWFEDLGLELLLSHNQLQLKSFVFKGSEGGRFRGDAGLDGSGEVPRFHLNLSANDLRLGLFAAPDQVPATFPPVEIAVILDGVGSTRHEMASSLDGKLRIYHGSGQVASAGVGFLFSDFITELFTTLNPFAKTSPYTQLDCSVLAANAVSGKVEVFPIIFQTEQLTVLSQGTIDLNTEKIDLSFNTKPRKGLGLSTGVLINPLIKVGGRLAAPAIELDPANTLVSGGIAVATIGISVLAKSMSDRFLSSKDPCGDARKEIDKRDSAGN